MLLNKENIESFISANQSSLTDGVMSNQLFVEKVIFYEDIDNDRIIVVDRLEDIDGIFIKIVKVIEINSLADLKSIKGSYFRIDTNELKHLEFRNGYCFLNFSYGRLTITEEGFIKRKSLKEVIFDLSSM